MKKGFTLIEMLIVVAIIAIIASVVIGFVTDAGSRSRDAKRKQTLDQLVKATNIYFSQNGDLPETTGTCHTVSAGTFATLVSDLAPYISKINGDPARAGSTGDYIYQNISDNAGTYKYCAIMENTSAANTSPVVDFSSCAGGTTGYNYCISQ